MFKEYLEEIRLKRSLAKVEKQHEAFEKTKKYKELTAKERYEEDQMYYQGDYAPIWEELEVLKTNKLLKKASKLSIPFPSRWKDKDKKYWEEGNYFYGAHYLTTVGFHELIKAIREEEHERNKVKIWWLPLISALTGLLGVLLGIISTIK